MPDRGNDDEKYGKDDVAKRPDEAENCGEDVKKRCNNRVKRGETFRGYAVYFDKTEHDKVNDRADGGKGDLEQLGENTYARTDDTVDDTFDETKYRNNMREQRKEDLLHKENE